MAISYEFFFQIANTILWLLVFVAIYAFIKNHIKKRRLLENKISNLENRVSDLENK